MPQPLCHRPQVREALLRTAVIDPQLTGAVQQNRRLDVSKIRAELNCSAP
ncbi:hypothetical protein [Stutzerimonas chloritidismutans]